MRNATRLAVLATFAVLSACGGDGTGPSDPVATSLAISAGSGQSATVGTAVTVVPAVMVKDQRGHGMAGVVVTFAVASGGGSLTGTLAVTTDAGGIARVGGWTLGTQSGANSLTATVAGLTPLTMTATGTAGAPASLVFGTTAPVIAQSGVALTTQPVLQLKDQFGNSAPQAGVAVTVVIATGGGTLGGTTVVNTNASGLATFTNLAVTGTIGARTLSFSATGLPALLSGSIQVNAGAPASVTAVGTTALSGTAGLVVGTPITIAVADQSGNPVAGATVTFAVTAGGGSLTGAVQATAVNGQAMLSSWTLGAVAGTLNTLSATVASLTPVVYSVTPVAGTAASLVLTTQPGGTSAVNGAAFSPQPVIQVSDAFGNAVPQSGLTVTAAIASGGGLLGGTTTGSTNASGVATFAGLSITGAGGAHTLSFTATALTPATSVSFTLTAGAATTLAVNGGNNQNGTVGAAVATAPSVLVTDQSGNAVSGVAVTFAVASGGGSLTAPSTTTNASGVATVGSWTLGTTAGTNTVTATSIGLTGSPITFTATGTPAPASQLTITTQPSAAATNGSALAQQPVVQLRDPFGNAVSQVVSVTATASASGTLAGTSTVSTNAGGQATFTNLVLNGLLGSYTISFSSAGVTSATSTSIALVAGAASQLTLTTQPSSTVTNGTVFVQQPVAQLRDAGGNLVSSAGVSVTVALSGSPAGVVLGGTTTVVTNAGGTATFTNLSLTGLVGSYTLGFSASGLTGVTSSSVGLLAGPATTLALSAGDNQTATVNTTVAIDPSVLVTDVSGNPVSGVVVTFAVAGGSGSIASGTGTTSASGLATGGNWTLGQTAGSNTLTATVASLIGSPVTFTATGTPAAATKLTLTTPPSATATNGVVLAQQPVLQLQDAFNNNVSLAGITVTATASAGGTLSGTVGVATNASGQASFTNLQLAGLVGNYTLSFAGNGLTGAASGPIALGAGAVSQMTITTQPSSSVVNGTTLTQQPAIQLRDVGGNAVSSGGVNIVASLTGTPAGVALGGTTTIATSGAGVATFTNLALTGLVGSYTLHFTSTSLSPMTSSAIALQTGPATTIVASAGDAQTATVNTAVTINPSVLITDVSGNPVTGASVTFAVAGGGGSATGTTALSASNGIATVGSWTLGGTAGGNSLTATSGSLTGSPVTFTATGTAAAASQLGITTQPSATATNGVALAQQPVLQLRDPFGNAVSASGVSVTATASLGGTLLGTTVVTTNVGGQASFTGLVLNGTIGNYTLSFASTGLTGATSTAIALGAGAVTQMTITTQPSGSVVNGNTLAQQPVIQLRDVSGNAVSSGGVNVIASLTGTPAGVALGGTTTIATSGAGVATFTNLALTGLVGSYTLRLTSAGLSPLTSTTVILQTGPATTLAASAGDGQTATVNTAVATNPSVLVTDASGNPVSGVVVTFGVASGGGNIASGTGTTSASGLATGGNWTLGQTAGSNTLTATVASLIGSPVTFTATGTPAAATKLTLTTPPSATATNGVVLAQQPVLQLQDAFNNNVSLAGITVTATASAGGTLSGTVGVATNASGQASFTNLQLAGLVGNYTLSFASNGLTGATSGTIALAVGAATRLAVTTQPSTTVINGGVLAQQPVVQLRDAGGNSVSTAAVNIVAALTGAPGGVALGGTTTIATSGAGASTFTNLSLTGLAGSYTLTFTSTGLTSAVSTSITVTAGAGVSLTANSVQTQSGRVGIAVTTLPSVKLVDGSGNPVAGATVTFAVTAGGGTLTGSSAITNALGIATVGNWIYGKRVLTNTVTAISGALPLVSFDGSPVFTASRVSAGAVHTCAVSVDGVPFCWGDNGSGALGDSSFSQRLSPVAVKTSLLFTTLSTGQAHSCGLTGSGAAACWGDNGRGQLGVNNIATQIAPVSVVGGPLAFNTIELGFDHSCGVSTGLSLYCWGGNTNGQLGNGVTSVGNRTTPLQIPGSFSQVSAGVLFSCGVRATTNVGNCWGTNGFGQLGDSTVTPR
ncbi:MAG: hypothetical protein ABI587_15300, partial [Gemmatimonadales bacterium]